VKLETYIFRIYRRDRNISDSLVGLVEEVGVEGKKPFRNPGQLWDILNAKTGETVQGENEKRQKMRKGEYIVKASTLTDNRVLTAKDELQERQPGTLLNSFTYFPIRKPHPPPPFNPFILKTCP